MSNYKFSVIIPCFNIEEQLIRRAVNSVLKQSYSNYEIILVDDGSKKEYNSILAALDKENDCISLIVQENKGVSAARNIGVANAKGDYIVFLDADDTYLQGVFERANKVLSEYELDCYIGGLEQLSVIRDASIDDGECKRFDLQGEELEKYKTIALRRETFPGGVIGRGPVCKFAKRELVDTLHFNENLVFGEDHIWFLDLLEKCKHIIVDYQIWYEYYINPDSVTNKYDPEIYQKTKDYLIELHRYVDENKPDHIKAYGDKVSTMINTIWRCKLNHEKGKNARKIRNSIYKDACFKPLGKKQYFKVAFKKQKVVSLLYKFRILFVFLRLTKYKGNIEG